MRILGIDQSYNSCGVIILEGEQLVHAERFVSNKDTDIYQRAWDIANKVSEVAVKFNVDFVAIEGLAFSKFGDATRDLAGLQFVIITTLRFINNYEVIVISPNAVKKVATGAGNASKDMMVDALPNEIKAHFDTMKLKKTTGLYDLTDAYFIARSGQKDLSTPNNAI